MIVIEELIIKYQIFIIEIGDCDLMFIQLFLNSMKFCQKYKPDKIFGTIIHPYIHQTFVFYILIS